MSVMHRCGHLLLAAWFVGLSLSSTRAAAQPLNVLLITSDDLGLQLSCYGNRVIQTPHLDALAETGVRFEVAYVTQASCSPSRSSMFTGLYPHATGQYGLMTPGNEADGFRLHDELHSQTIPAQLKAAGYRVIANTHDRQMKSSGDSSTPYAHRRMRAIASPSSTARTLSVARLPTT